jgi:hypothetical protein
MHDISHKHMVTYLAKYFYVVGTWNVYDFYLYVTRSA